MSTTSTTVRSVSIRKPSENIIADTFSNVGAIKSIMVLDERVQPWQKGKLTHLLHMKSLTDTS